MGVKKHKIRVCHFSSAHRYNDIRIFEKECATLADYGYVVYFVVPDTEDMILKDVRITGVPASHSRFGRMTKTAYKVYKKARNIDADIYHFHDAELLPYGLLLRAKGKKVVYDVHEYLADDILDKAWIHGKYLRKIISVIVSLFEKTCAMFYSRIVTVTPEIGYGFQVERTVVIRNLPILNWINSVLPAYKSGSDKVVIYSGGLTRLRGIKEIIDAMQLVNNAELWLIGNWESNEFMEECLGGVNANKIKYLGYKTQDEVYALNKAADIGIINFYRIPNHVKSLPNKSFEYMACGMPMVLSDFDYWRTHFGTCALFAEPKDKESIARAINNLLHDDKLRNKLSTNAKTEVFNNYSWESESIKLVDMYNELSKDLD